MKYKSNEEVDKEFDLNIAKWLETDPIEPTYMITDMIGIKKFISTLRAEDRASILLDVEEKIKNTKSVVEDEWDRGWNSCIENILNKLSIKQEEN